MKVVIAGSGNVATVLGRKILAAGNEIIEIVGRNRESTLALAALLKSSANYDSRTVNCNADIYIICVSDGSIAEVASGLKLNDKIAVHTAAAVSKEVLRSCGKNYGVLYPLQTLRKELETVPPIPVLIDGNNVHTKKVLFEFAAKWAETVEIANDEERLKLHVAAVFSNNFTNHLFAVCKQYCTGENLKFEMFYPIIEETIRRIKGNNPADVQTGPAVRRDLGTIEKHERVLTAYPKVLKLYSILTRSIVDFYKRHDKQ